MNICDWLYFILLLRQLQCVFGRIKNNAVYSLVKLKYLIVRCISDVFVF
jgi:hypothetical protein